MKLRSLAWIVAALAVPLAAPAAAQQTAITLASNEVLLKVQATGTFRSRPDLMSLTAGVVTTGRTAREAIAANNQLAGRLLAAVRAQGVADGDIKTEELSVRPQFAHSKDDEDSDESSRITGYVATNSLVLSLRDLTKGPALIDALFQAGANKVEGPRFELSDPAPAEKRARQAAVAAALEQAKTYADALHMRINRVLQVSERSEAQTTDVINSLPSLRSTFAPATPVESGDLTTGITVWIDYALVPMG
ncbi:MAG TPA: SIMPL domain-containing protein [Allosphingosinicella sp.]|jgi:hypothetical protein|nr:SIMPL domain-containing protein [Allosphingosinicella sp.]